MEIVSENRCFGGTQGVYRHRSESTGTNMQFSVFVPRNEGHATFPTVTFLSGLTCTEQNFTTKAGAQRYAAEHHLMVVAPDTSPRGLGLPGEDESSDFGTGAGFYVDATIEPWSAHYRMYRYVTEELPAVIQENFPADPMRQGLCGHSMGGHGALVIGLRNPEKFRSVSAFAPICEPSAVPWGQKAFRGYLGSDKAAWNAYDTVALLKAGRRHPHILVDQGDQDPFLDHQLLPHRLVETAETVGQPLELRYQPGYDHGYYFIATFIGSHLAYHAERLGR